MMLRPKDATEAQSQAANDLGRRIWWLNVWLLVFTVMICGLTVVLVLVELTGRLS